MSDTIELLESIGKNAAMRHASAEELAHALGQMDASDGLKAAAKTGDSSSLFAELGHKPMRVNHDVHGPGHEEDEPDHDHDEDDSNQPSKPSHSEPPLD